MGSVYCGPTNNYSRNVPRASHKQPERTEPKTLGQLVDEMIAAFGTEDGERTRISVLLRMGLPVSR